MGIINLNLKEMSNKEWDRKSYAQSEALNALHEECVIIYREKIPERRVFYVDIGKMPPKKGEKYVQDLIMRYRNAQTGQVKDDTEVGKTGIDWIVEAVKITQDDLIVVAEDIDEIVLESTYNEKDEKGLPVGFSYSTKVLEKLVDLEGLLVNASYQLSLLQILLETGDEQEFINLWSTPL